MITHTYNAAISSTSGGTSLSCNYTETGNVEQTLDVAIPASTTDQSVAVAFSYTALQSIFLTSDQPVTVKINSTSTPPVTINLKAGIPFEWSVSPGYFPNPFGVNVTVIYVTTTAAARLRAKILTT